MKITKDEARILEASINDFKFRLNEESNIDGLFSRLEDLEQRLEKFGKDKRRTGRTSQDDWYSLIRRFAKNK